MARTRGAILLARQSKSQDEIAEKIGVSRVSVSKWVNGHSKPTKSKRDELESAFGIPVAAWSEDAPAGQPGVAAGQKVPVPEGVVPMAVFLRDMARQLLVDLNEGAALPLERAKVMNECGKTLKHVEEITKAVDRFETVILVALRPYPEAAKAVQAAWRKANAE